MKNLLLFIALTLVVTSCKKSENTTIVKRDINVDYPQTKKVDTVDTYFGTDVKDPYRWLEDDRSKETEDWVKRQNQATFAYLDNIAKREFVALYQQLQAEGLSLVLATHDSEAAKQCGEQFIFIANEGILFFEDWESLSRSENQKITHYLARIP